MQHTVLITGADGQLGEAIQASVKQNPVQGYNFIFTDKSTFDIASDEAYKQFQQADGLFAIINCAAYTQVDNAEEDEKIAYMLNAEAVIKLTVFAQKHNAFLLHVSTDYVFDGTAHRPYNESGHTHPVSVYGKSKRAGEEAVLAYDKGTVIRTSWLYSSTGNNFVKTMLRLGKERKSLNVVDDQIGTPTNADDLANALLELLKQAEQLPVASIFHYSNEGVCSWYDFAVSIMKLAELNCHIQPIPSEEFPTKAPRPSYSVMSKKKIRAYLKEPIPHWQESLASTLKVLAENQ